ncbi:MAG TPA: TlpA disulfide reductase family protein [Pirellulales bacterium]|nr:TlpA disulfide reductase family protein [Pirellulales bacterium]
MIEPQAGSGRWWLGFLLIVAVGLAAVVVWRRQPVAPLPSLELDPLTGASEPVTLADLKGKVALVNFWGTWCPPCRDEFPHIVELDRHYRARSGFRLLAVSSDGGSDNDVEALRETTSEFLKQHDATDLPTYVDRGGRTRAAISAAIGFRGYPTTLVLDRTGTIRGSWVGYHPGTETAMAALVDRLLAE